MESYLPISYLNDFIFCPRSIFLHQLFGQYDISLYHRSAQTFGRLKHDTIEKKNYSTAKRYLLNYDVYSIEFGLCGKIDIYDQEECKLVERKAHIKEIYDGYLFQIYAHYFCLKEMGNDIASLFFHSLKDNKRYSIPLPTEKEAFRLHELVEKIKSYRLEESFSQNQKKCFNCIYNPLCDVYEADNHAVEREIC